ncbi:hypothetical protein AB4455_26205 [Vibrio sp. 10N.261.46.E12]|uniref:hypothetical protein n=1 Tax=unclassified Vibrio TaxID=2614977 RepID=UPI0009757D1A|nr:MULTISPECIES: hypothetical protein [unclassified Vibrio]OMO37694.1 hypothetical protein BH584_21415 [Vibrio sp. 10N.261.45.E1]PMJ36888.1 hypothetical protein BCU27_22710 [Vibrio sp. 10N.286.45.B6]PML93597.1 hypothetical protein BCT66_24335 [Vibrio sp. 10N.261.49.E11]PMM86140.1 hypothetical protein BCT46_08635 [Vibrio sp. 10N.261.46.E8]PMN50175.1 hypothetical protein BCT32_04865 [Vibrio sp. 10N.261.45.E11]
MMNSLPLQALQAKNANFYQANELVKYLAKHSGYASISNILAMDFPVEAKAQFCTLTGMSQKKFKEYGFKNQPVIAEHASANKRHSLHLEVVRKQDPNAYWPLSHLQVYPYQPIVVNDNELRFIANTVVAHLVDSNPKGLTLNDLIPLFSPFEFGADYEQLAQLLGYPLHGFAELRYASRETVRALEIQASNALTSLDCRVKALSEILKDSE